MLFFVDRGIPLDNLVGKVPFSLRPMSYLKSFLIGLFLFAVGMLLQAIADLLVVEETLRDTSAVLELNTPKVILLVIVAPLMETIIFQMAIISLLLGLKLSRIVALTFSAMAFAGYHFIFASFSLQILVEAIPLVVSGGILGCVYLLSLETKGKIQAAKYTMFSHSVNNMAVVILIFLFQT